MYASISTSRTVTKPAGVVPEHAAKQICRKLGRWPVEEPAREPIHCPEGTAKPEEISQPSPRLKYIMGVALLLYQQQSANHDVARGRISPANGVNRAYDTSEPHDVGHAALLGSMRPASMQVGGTLPPGADTTRHRRFDLASGLDIAVAWALPAGAKLADHQPQEYVSTMLDPAGHPFELLAGLVD